MADTPTTTLYAEIVKAERNEDGDLVVVGKATGPDLDLDSQICDPAWLAKAMPEWMSTGGNLREQHSSIAAGVATELSQEGDSWMVAGLIVDPVSARKVEKGVLKGYSIGVRHPQVIKDKVARGGRVVGGTVVEVSLVDRPCNPTCTLTLAKAMTVDDSPELVKVEELHEDVEPPSVMPTPRDLAARLSKAASDLAVRLGTEATPGGDPAQPAVDPTEHQPSTEPDPVPDSELPAAVETTKAAEGEPADPAQTPTTTTTSSGGATTVTYDTSALTSALIPSTPVFTVSKGAMAPLKEGGPKRYPINSVADLKNAIQAFGRGKPADKAAIKAHIISEAKRLGRSDLIPDNWKMLLTKDATALDALDDTSGMRHDPAALRAVLSGLADVMKAELDELVDGDDEYWDLTLLMRSMSAFTSWWAHEAARGETSPPFDDSTPSYLEYTVTPDQTKADAPDGVEIGATDTPAGEETQLAELVKTALADMETKLTKAAEERTTALAAELATVKADLEKALALPEPGGPVITRTTGQPDARDTDVYRTRAAEYIAKSKQPGLDRTLRIGYQELAEQALAKAAA